MRWKWMETDHEVERPRLSPQQAGRERIRADLELRGLSPDVAARMSLCIEDRAASLTKEDYETLLDGVSLAAAAQEETAAEMAQHLNDLQEIERLMSGFSRELGKLDEVLEVMAVHVRKMRNNAPTTGERLLH